MRVPLTPAPASLLHGALAKRTRRDRRRRASATALFGAACLVGGVAIGWIAHPSAPPAVVATAPVHIPDEATARFVLYAPQAEEVTVVGTFTDWKPVPMQRSGDVYYLTLEVEHGRHEYLFKVDESWVVDPAASTTAADDFGSKNSILMI